MSARESHAARILLIEVALDILSDPDLDGVADRIADRGEDPISLGAFEDVRRTLEAARTEIKAEWLASKKAKR